MIMKSLRISFIIGISLFVAACSSDSDTSADTGNDAATDDVPTAETTASDITQDVTQEAKQDAIELPDSNVEDIEQQDVPPGECIKVSTVSGSVENESGKSLQGATATLCVHVKGGVSSCESPAKSGMDGTFKVVLTKSDKCLSGAAYQLQGPVGKAMPTLYCTLDLKQGGNLQTHGVDRLVQAPTCQRKPFTSEDNLHEITASNGTIVKIRPKDIAGLTAEDFRYDDIQLLVWDNTKWGWPCFIDSASPPNGLIGISPELEIPPDAFDSIHIAFKNDKNLAPKTVVDVMVVGAATTKTYDGKTIGEGQWKKATEAIVTDDGNYIETVKGKGLPIGVWVGWVEKK